MNIEKHLLLQFKKAFKSIFLINIDQNKIQLNKTKKEFEGDFTINIFPFLKQSKLPPEETAKKIGNYLLENKEIDNFNVIKGFLNLNLKQEIWTNFLQKTLQLKKFWKIKQQELVMVEYSSPNTNKPLHLGHLRNNFLGYAISKIFEASGKKIIKTQIINDRGIHICKSMIAWQKFGKGKTPISENIKGDKFVGNYYVIFNTEYKKQVDKLIQKGLPEEDAKKQAPILIEAHQMLKKWEKQDPKTIELWTKMNNWVYKGFDKTYKKMGIDFDFNYYESKTYLYGKNIIEKGLKQKVFYKKKDGSIWCDLTKEGLKEKLLLRKDKTAVYITQDIGTAVERFENYKNLKKLVYTVGNEQDYHFKVLFSILNKMGYPWAKNCYHLSYGMVELPEGKMKSREGTIVDADTLIDEMIYISKQELELRNTAKELSHDEINKLSKTIGLGALKYFLLKVDPKKKMLFNPKESINLNGNTAPFIQYTHARIKALLRREVSPKNIFENYNWNQKEKELIKIIYDFPKILNEAAINYSPALICNYIYDLVKNDNSFYQSVKIFNTKNKEAKKNRLAVSFIVSKIIKEGMNIIGINVPEKM